MRAIQDTSETLKEWHALAMDYAVRANDAQAILRTMAEYRECVALGLSR